MAPELNAQQLSAIGEQLRMLTSIALGRKVTVFEDMEMVNQELMQRYLQLPELKPGQGRTL